MSSEKFTKGKWELQFTEYERPPKRVCIGVGVDERVIGGTYTTFVCNSMLPDSDPKYIQQEENILADMRLIAAAPEMYFLLKEIWDNSDQIESIYFKKIDSLLNTINQ